jgi:hypothetical protein
VINAKKNLSDIGVLVTVSELAYGYQERNASGSQAVLDAIDVINAHMLPFFAGDATRGVYSRLALSPSLQEMSDVSFRSECVAGRFHRLAMVYQPRFGKEDKLGRGNATPCTVSCILCPSHKCSPRIDRMAGRLPIKGLRILDLKARTLSLASAMNRLIIDSSIRAASTLRTLSVVASAGLLTSIRTFKSLAMGFTTDPEC